MFKQDYYYNNAASSLSPPTPLSLDTFRDIENNHISIRSFHYQQLQQRSFVSHEEQEAAQALIQLGSFHIDSEFSNNSFQSSPRRSSSCTTLDTAVTGCSSIMSTTSSSYNSNMMTKQVTKNSKSQTITPTVTKKNNRRRQLILKKGPYPSHDPTTLTTIKPWHKKKPRWQGPEKESLFTAIIEDKRLDDMATFHWDKIAKLVGRAGKACKDQWRREILPALNDSFKS
ncbi:hypothetical protein BDA99DRAFT_518453 [Phascolomyces articulosus]|uniref:Myb-like domain-containing protein n=1 Tax=Phascolomyces articulosus TaxID=60185 RepID=A0AAD5K7F7_9FUNG|nr:hypothetical protein BDA99DRAFT_518453 [Phascolomyces articulosus]